MPSCQGVNLSEAVQCDTIYSEIPNLSALIFQPQWCLSQCARDDWSIYKTAAANLLNIYVQCHVQESSRIYSNVLCSYIQEKKKNQILALHKMWETPPAWTESLGFSSPLENVGFEPSRTNRWRILGIFRLKGGWSVPGLPPSAPLHNSSSLVCSLQRSKYCQKLKVGVRNGEHK